MHFSSTAAALSLAALAAPVSAFWRMPCPGRIVTERIDPIVDPGVVAGHVHQVAGGNGFGFTETYANARNSSCSSCPITQDLSNYWTPILYYQAQNGSFTKVPQSGDGNGVYGGMTVYYEQRPGANNDTLKAFPEGFRMMAGNPYKRNYTDDFAGQAVSFVCLNYDAPADYTGYTSQLPTQSCPDGLRAQIYFPSCWDGVNLDSSDHESHVSYPASGAYNDGECPSTHPVHLISIFFEVIFSTAGFEWWDGNYGTNQPFVFSMGDPTGYGFHGDFVNGWDVDALQEAVDECTDLSGLITDCPVFDFFETSQCQDCILPVSVDEDITGPMEALPGCNPVTAGPADATAVANCPVTPISAIQLDFTDVISTLNWEYVGCGNDSTSSRTFTGYTNMYNTDQSGTTVESCIKTCESENFIYAGLEDSTQCFCGNTIPADRAPIAGSFGNCVSTCAGNSSEYCGGASALSIYKNCNGSSTCVNAGYEARGDLTGTGVVAAASVVASSVAGNATSAVYSAVASATYAASTTAVSAQYNKAHVASVASSVASGSSIASSSSSHLSSAHSTSRATATSTVHSTSHAKATSTVHSSSACVPKTIIHTHTVTTTHTVTASASATIKRDAKAAKHLRAHKQARN